MYGQLPVGGNVRLWAEPADAMPSRSQPAALRPKWRRGPRDPVDRRTQCELNWDRSARRQSLGPWRWL